MMGEKKLLPSVCVTPADALTPTYIERYRLASREHGMTRHTNRNGQGCVRVAPSCTPAVEHSEQS